MITALQATIDARGALTLLNHAMSIYRLDQQYEIGFGGDPMKPEDDRSPFVRVMGCGHRLAQYSFDANGVITAHGGIYGPAPTDWEQEGRDLENFDMHTKGEGV